MFFAILGGGADKKDQYPLRAIYLQLFLAYIVQKAIDKDNRYLSVFIEDGCHTVETHQSAIWKKYRQDSNTNRR